MSFFKKNWKELSSIIISISIALVYYYIIPLEMYNLSLVLVMLLLINNIVFAVMSFRKRILYFLFNIVFFVFILSRPFIYMLRSEKWWTIFSPEINLIALNCIILSLLFLTVGTLIWEKCVLLYEEKHKTDLNIEKKSMFDVDLLQKICLVVMLISMVCYFIMQFDKLIFMSNRSYEDFYSQYSPNVPYIIRVIGNFYHTSLFAYLATFPKKKSVFIVLSLYIISGIPMLKIGTRNDFVLPIILSFVYYFLRDNIRTPSEKKWIGKIEKTLIVVTIPLMIVGLGAYNYVRSDMNFSFKPVELSVDFLFKQGTTYDTVLQGIQYQDEIPGRERNFTFGPVYDYVKYGKIGNVLLGTDSNFLGKDGNNLVKAYNDSKFSYAISYKVMGSDYIAGKGRGSSYLIENYIDFGYIGVSLISLLFGFVLSWMTLSFKGNWLKCTMILSIISSIFMTPRETTTYAFLNIINHYFWIVIFGILILYVFYKKIFKRSSLNDILNRVRR